MTSRSKQKKHSQSRKRQPSLFESPHVSTLVTESERLKLLGEWKRVSRKSHGGQLSARGRKDFRPLDSTKCLHIVLKSEKASGALSFLHDANQAAIEQICSQSALRFNVQLEDFANVGNHLHLKIRFLKQQDAQNFLRVLPAQISRLIMGCKRGKPTGRFWDGRAYTRIITSRKEELRLRGYFEANRIEARRSKLEREKYLCDFNRWIATLAKSNVGAADSKKMMDRAAKPDTSSDPFSRETFDEDSRSSDCEKLRRQR